MQRTICIHKRTWSRTWFKCICMSTKWEQLPNKWGNRNTHNLWMFLKLCHGSAFADLGNVLKVPDFCGNSLSNQHTKHKVTKNGLQPLIAPRVVHQLLPYLARLKVQFNCSIKTLPLWYYSANKPIKICRVLFFARLQLSSINVAFVTKAVLVTYAYKRWVFCSKCFAYFPIEITANSTGVWTELKMSCFILSCQKSPNWLKIIKWSNHDNYGNGMVNLMEMEKHNEM